MLIYGLRNTRDRCNKLEDSSKGIRLEKKVQLFGTATYELSSYNFGKCDTIYRIFI